MAWKVNTPSSYRTRYRGTLELEILFDKLETATMEGKDRARFTTLRRCEDEGKVWRELLPLARKYLP